MRITLFSFILCCYYFIYVTHASPKCLKDQRSLLLQLKNNLTFHPENSTKLMLWNQNTACCNWSGVTCDNEGHVIGLDLSGEYITGGFDNSSSIFSFQHLRKLNLAHNNFSSLIPSGFNKLVKLTYLDLSYNEFLGKIPIEISQLTRLVNLYLSNCKFYGTLPNSMSNLTRLEHLDLSYNDLSGAIPNSISNLTDLTLLNLSHNYLSGSIPSYLFTLPLLEGILLQSNQFSKFEEFINVSSSVIQFLYLSKNNLSGSLPNEILALRNLYSLDLSYNNISINENHTNAFFEEENDTNVYQPSFPYISILWLASCNLKTFPSFLRNQSLLTYLDLSNNQIQGVMPNWIWKLQFLEYLYISHNFLTELEGALQNITSNLKILDLHNNKLLGLIPIFPASVEYLDLSTNNFSGIPRDIGNYLPNTIFLSLSNNNLEGSFPHSLCKASNLQVLDLSFNNISGTISPCLITMTRTLEALNLQQNHLNGPIPDMFPSSCSLRSLKIHENFLNGTIPMSLSHCSSLKVLDIASNQIVGGFPCFLKNIPTLSVLVLRNNKFHGSIECSHLQENKPWKMIQIVDIAFNDFNGKLPETFFTTWEKMMHNEDHVVSDFIHIGETSSLLYYQDSVSVSTKGQEMKLVKILTIFTAIDFSSNHFEGPIPEVLMKFKAIYVLNFSNNAFSGEIPSTIGNLKQLESLDLSNNSLVGEIPLQLASMTFLSYLNLSFNHLVGKIPTGTQLQSFEASSFEGNYGLYGPPLTETPNGKGHDEMHPQQTFERLACSIDWNFLSLELGFVFGLGIIIGPLLFWKKWRVSYWKLVDKILCWIFRRMYFEYATDRGQTYKILRW